MSALKHSGLAPHRRDVEAVLLLASGRGVGVHLKAVCASAHLFRRRWRGID